MHVHMNGAFLPFSLEVVKQGQLSAILGDTRTLFRDKTIKVASSACPEEGEKLHVRLWEHRVVVGHRCSMQWTSGNFHRSQAHIPRVI